jgi:hypothetical protein
MTTDQSTGANSVRVEGTTQMAENELHVDMQLSTYAAEDPLRQRLTGFGVVAAGLAVAVVVGRTVLGGRTD